MVRKDEADKAETENIWKTTERQRQRQRERDLEIQKVTTQSYKSHTYTPTKLDRKHVNQQVNFQQKLEREKHKWATSWQNQQNGMCAQRRLRSAWASTQSDQSLHCRHEESLGDAQADLSLRWAHSHFVGFVVRQLKSKQEACITTNGIPYSNS